MKPLVAADREWAVQRKAIQDEFVAVDQSFAARGVGGRRLGGGDWAAVVVDRGQRLRDVQRARFSLGVDPIEIEQPKGRVARLLDFGDHQPGPQGVYGAGLDEHAIAHTRLELVETLLARARRQGGAQSVAGHARLEPGVDLAARIGGQHDPGFGLAQVGRVELGGLLVVGMHLHRERAVAVEEFQQQRKLPYRVVPAKQFRPVLDDQLVQRQTARRTGGHNTLVVAMVDHFPTLGVVVPLAKRFAQHGLQPSPAPQVAAEQGLESQWIVADGHG